MSLLGLRMLVSSLQGLLSERLFSATILMFLDVRAIARLSEAAQFDVLSSTSCIWSLCFQRDFGSTGCLALKDPALSWKHGLFEYHRLFFSNVLRAHLRSRFPVIKFVIVGPRRVGKASILRRWISGNYHEGERFVPYRTRRSCMINQELYALDFWLIEDSYHYTNMSDPFLSDLSYEESLVVLFVYDVKHKSSFLAMHEWVDLLRNYMPKRTPMMLFGNKTDEELVHPREVSREEGHDEAQRLGLNCGWAEGSAKTNANMVHVPRALLVQASMLHRLQSDPLQGTQHACTIF